MASNDKSEDEILGLGSSNANLNLSTDDNKDSEDISCIDEEMLLSSPSPSPAREKSEKNGSSTSPIVSETTVSKTTIEVKDDDDDEPEIIDDDDEEDVEEITQSSENTDDDGDEEVLEEIESDGSDYASFMDGKINIFSCHGSLLLWNAEDAQMLREECRIVGKLVGCLPRAPRQNSQLGLPLQLMPEEAKLLVDIDAAVVVEEEGSVTNRTMKIREAAFRNVRQTNYRIQQNLYKESRKEEVKQRMGDIIAGKKAKKRKLQTEHSKGVDETGSVQNEQTCDQENNTGASRSETDGDKEKEKSCNEEKENGEDRDGTDTLTVDDILSTSAETSEKHSLVQIFTENPWKQTYRSDANWIFPGTEKEMLRYLVFKDLWGKGFYLTSGSKFGGDFLVYPGDPARFHSHYIAICKNQHEEMPCLDIITLGRLASNVRKTALLCALDRHGKVFYTSLQWTGIS